MLVLVALGLTILQPAGQYRVTAFFKQTVGLYPGSSVRILGIAVGTVDNIVPEGDRVKVTMSLDDNYAVPADADAVVLAPSLVSDRYVQFSPVYNGGPKMKDGAVVPLERTATPVELDSVYGALDLWAPLGPNGANKNGALSDLVDVGAANLKGNGERSTTPSPGSHRRSRRWPTTATTCSTPWTTCRSSPARSPRSTRRWGSSTRNLAAVSEQLAGERKDLATAVNLLSKALGDVAGFVRTNTTLLTSNVNKLADVTLALVQQRRPSPRCSTSLRRHWRTSPTPTTPTTARWTPATTRRVPQPRGPRVPGAGRDGTGQIGGINIGDPTALLGLPPTDAICARLLSGDASDTARPTTQPQWGPRPPGAERRVQRHRRRSSTTTRAAVPGSLRACPP